MTVTRKAPAKKTAAKKTAAKKTATPRESVVIPEETLEVSSASEFKKGQAGKVMRLPSGQVVRARRVELKTFLRQGQIPNGLLSIVQGAIDKGKTQDAQALMAGANIDLDKVAEMYEMVDMVVQAVVIEPKIHPLPTHSDDGVELTTEEEIKAAKKDDLVYTDDIDDESKMFLFQYSTGGTDDVATFREEARAGLAALAPGQDFGG